MNITALAIYDDLLVFSIRYDPVRQEKAGFFANKRLIINIINKIEYQSGCKLLVLMHEPA